MLESGQQLNRELICNERDQQRPLKQKGRGSSESLKWRQMMMKMMLIFTT